MMRCAHSNIISLLQLAEFEYSGVKYGYLVERLMDGGTLDDRQAQGLLSREEALALGDELIRAVSHIADNDLVHRDFKPANDRREAPCRQAELSPVCESEIQGSAT